MESNLRDLLDKIYELEGLVHLALKRDEAAKDFLRLISKKGEEVGQICSSLQEREHDPDEIEEKKASLKAEPATENLDEEESYLQDKAFLLNEYTLEEEIDDIEDTDEISYTSSIEGEDEEMATANLPKESARGRLVFSINDRFRFRKELFDNSDADFNNTLALVASMENYEEAEDYFLNEEGFDIASPAVRDFLEVIKKYFK